MDPQTAPTPGANVKGKSKTDVVDNYISLGTCLGLYHAHLNVISVCH